MNWLIVLGIFMLLAVILLILNNWQSKIERVQKAKLNSELASAREDGTSQPLAQHPQIDIQACIGCGTCIEACPEDGVLGLVDGVAKVIHGSRCIGHGICQDVCPVQAIEIGLGDTSGRSDLPQLTPTLETSVPGVYIAGELGGFALIRLAIEQGIRVVDAIAQELKDEKNAEGSVDVFIVGAGPAGFAASLRCLELGLTYKTIDQEDLGGTIRKYPRRKLTLTGPMTLPLYGEVQREEFFKEELIEFLEEVQSTYNLKLATGIKLLNIEKNTENSTLTCHTSAGSMEAKRAILALGRRGTPRRLNVPGEDAEKVLYQLVDASTYQDEDLLIVGGGDSAVEAAFALARQNNNRVTLSYRRDKFFRLKKRNEEKLQSAIDTGHIEVLFQSEVLEIEDRQVLLNVTEDGVERQQYLQNNYVFVCAGGEPPYPLLDQIGIQMGSGSSHEEFEEETTSEQDSLVEEVR